MIQGFSTFLARARFHRHVVGVALVTATLGLASPPALADRPSKNLNISTSTSTGLWYGLSGAWAALVSDRVPSLNVTAQPGPGGVGNARILADQDAEIVWMLSDGAYNSMHGKGLFEGQAIPNLRAMMSTFAPIMHIISNEGSGINSFEDLDGMRVAVGPAGSASQLVVAGLAELANISVRQQYISFSEGLQGLQDGNTDATGFMTQPGNAAVTAMAVERALQIAPVSQELIDAYIEITPGFATFKIPGGTYEGIDEDIKTLGAMSLVLTTTDYMTEDEVYDFVSTIWNERSRWADVHAAASVVNLETALDAISVPLHAGAYRYYVEQGMEVAEEIRPPEVN